MGCRVDLLRNFLSISQLLEQVLRLPLAESVDEFPLYFSSRTMHHLHNDSIIRTSRTNRFESLIFYLFILDNRETYIK